jgi:hypothetical protein
MALPLIVEVIRAARVRDPHIGTIVNAGIFTIVRAIPRKGRAHDVTKLSDPMPGWQAVEALQRFADGGEL